MTGCARARQHVFVRARHPCVCARVYVFARLEAGGRWRFSHLRAKWSVLPSPSATQLLLLYKFKLHRAEKGVSARRRRRRRGRGWQKTVMARFFSRFAGAKDLHAQDLKRHEKLDGVLGVNLGTGLSAGGGLTLHQELIMTMPGTGKRFTVFQRTYIFFAIELFSGWSDDTVSL